MPWPATALERAHDLMHRLPGMPAHTDRHAGAPHAVRQGHAAHPAHARHALPRTPRGRLSHPPHPPHALRPPRVLVRWQRWIGSLFGVELP